MPHARRIMEIESVDPKKMTTSQKSELHNLQQKAKSTPPQLKEVVVYKNGTIHVFNITEWGRRYFRTIVYTNSSSLCLHDFTAKLIYRGKAAIPCLIGGDPRRYWTGRTSLLVLRNLNLEIGPQLQIPERLLRGVVPHAILEKYIFWRNEVNGKLFGYLRVSSKLERPTLIEIDVENRGSTDKSGQALGVGVATIRRFTLLEKTIKPVFKGGLVGKIDESVAPLRLVNLLDVSHSLESVRDVLTRMENLSHIFVWAASDNRGICSIELPRLGLSFTMKKRRLYCNEHAGLFVSSPSQFNDVDTRKLLTGIPHGLVLQNESESLFVLVPSSTRPTRPPSRSTPLPTALLMERNNRKWLDGLGDTRHYLYPIHRSRQFLFATSLASSLYLLLLRLLSRQYASAFRLCTSCASDQPLSDEEAHIFDQLQYVKNDPIADAVAVRLKMSLCTRVEDTMKTPWSVKEELVQYVLKSRHVSSECRLTLEEEHRLFEMCGEVELKDNEIARVMRNRRRLLIAAETMPKSKETAFAMLREIEYPLSNIKSRSFHQWKDDSCVVNGSVQELKKYWSALKLVSYNRPCDKEKCPKLSGTDALKKINEWLADGGVRLYGIGGHRLGFLFLYELFTNTIDVRVLSTDETSSLARLLLYSINSEDTSPSLYV